jgi:4-alpha-glucanotransferase
MIPLLFAIHSHQPVGNFDHIFERGIADSYHPFLELLAQHSRFKAGIHYSGCLLEWIEAHRPDHVELLAELVRRGQVEIIGGGFYEPILPIIPERDARDQIVRYGDHLERLFGRRPRGLWLTERVWDPRLPELLAATGIAYTLVDDSHFRYGGVEPHNIWGPFLTESRGHACAIFPIDKYLRYIIPFREPDQTVSYIKERAAHEPGFVACYGDDGEKFGMWPGTHEWVFVKGWLRRFFRAIEDAGDAIEPMHFSDYLDAHGPRGRVYLPPASYEEMMEWVLPPRQGQRLEDFKHELQEHGRWEERSSFVRGGHWDMFLAKYDETNRMHKRMLLASDRLARIPDAPADARAALLRGQCNCAYWHGVFGGLYLNYLRHAVYEQLLTAEALAHACPALKIEQKDYDLDGSDELIVSSPEINAIISPRQGGSMVALEYPPKRFSLGNTLGRREEAYHRKLFKLANRAQGDSPATIHDEMQAKEEGLEKHLVYDRFPRVSLQDHFLAPGLDLDEIERETAVALGHFAGAPYLVTAVTDDSMTLEREDQCGNARIRLGKTVSFKPGRAGFTATYQLVNSGPEPLTAVFGVEWNLTLLAGHDPGRYYLVNGQKPDDPLMDGRGRHEGVTECALADEAFGFSAGIRASAPAILHRFPVETVSQSESGYERNYQGSALWLTWPLGLAPGGQWTATLEFDLREPAPAA